MPKWWPWGRSANKVAAEPATAAGQTFPPMPSWQRLAPLQRTVGLEPTALLGGFAYSLTTSQNPGLTRPVQLLAADDAGLLPVLDMARSTVSTDSVPAPTPPTAAGSRRWAPRFASVQRAHVGTVTSMRRAAEDIAAADEPSPHVYAVDVTDAACTEPKAMVEAADPDDRRTLDVADESAPPVGPAPDPTVPPVSAPNATPSAAPARVQRTPSDTGPASPVVQPLPTDPGRTPTPAPLRTLSPVQRLATSSPLPALRTLRSAEPTTAADISRPTPTAADRVSESVLGRVPTVRDAPPIQRAPQPDAVERATAEAATPPPAPTVLLSTDTRARAEPTASAPIPTNASSPFVVQRTAATPDQPSSTTTAVNVRADAAQPPAASVQRLPVIQTHPVTRTAPAGGAPAPVLPPTLQRSPAEAPTRPPLTSADEHAPTHLGQFAGEIRTEHQLPSAPSEYHSVDIQSELLTTGRPEPAPSVSGATEPGVVQRMTLPVAHPVPQPAAGPQRSSAAPQVPSVVQRSSAAGRRLVVLPPVRRSSDVQRTPDSAQAHEHTDVFHSPRPVGLQRMFGPSPDRFEPVTTTAPGTSHPLTDAATHESPYNTAPSDTKSYDAAANTITFAPPSVQRETTEAAPEPAPVADSGPSPTDSPAAATPTLTAAPAPGAPAPAAPDVDELVNRLYDPLAARLRAELWLDRERAGVLMDLSR